MNYCVLNGIKSNTVKGLLIQSLPPVSKPLMRTEITEIDGRDGDIITNLGYSAYDKDMEIGLYGDFNIDDVISYFDSQGTVTFSNEPDKYYNYQIINQIDFERLLRFRTATVTFHVQPFKYSAVGEMVSAGIDSFKGFQDFNQTKNGITLAANGSDLTISGKGASGYTEAYIPINPVALPAGTYTLRAYANGTGANACPMRLIQSLPTDGESFGGRYLSLANNSTSTMNATLTTTKTYNYVWVYITPNVTIDFTLGLNVVDSAVTSMTLLNIGNTTSRPTFDIVGSGAITLNLNGLDVLGLNLGINQQITIDVADMSAYSGSTLMNRSITGDYSNLAVPAGTNVLSWDGIVTALDVTDVSRWI